jgi:hypothetical protein
MVVAQSMYQVAYPKLVGIQTTAEQARDEAMIGNAFKVFDQVSLRCPACSMDNLLDVLLFLASFFPLVIVFFDCQFYQWGIVCQFGSML